MLLEGWFLITWANGIFALIIVELVWLLSRDVFQESLIVGSIADALLSSIDKWGYYCARPFAIDWSSIILTVFIVRRENLKERNSVIIIISMLQRFLCIVIYHNIVRLHDNPGSLIKYLKGPTISRIPQLNRFIWLRIPLMVKLFVHQNITCTVENLKVLYIWLTTFP